MRLLTTSHPGAQRFLRFLSEGLLISMLALALAGLIMGVHALIPDLSTPPSVIDSALAATLEPDELPNLEFKPLWVDARRPSERQSAPVESAIGISEEQWDEGFQEILAAWFEGQPIVVFCNKSDCDASRKVANRLRDDLGQPVVFWLEGGYTALPQELRRGAK